MKPLLTILLLFVSTSLSAPPPILGTIFRDEGINPYNSLFKAIAEVESKGDSLAWNRKELACGISQIRPIRLKDFNRRTGKNYKLKDCFKVSVSREIFFYYCQGEDLEKIARCWNAGPGGEKMKATLKYWKKVKSNLKYQTK
jgi:hypothetical protein